MAKKDGIGGKALPQLDIAAILTQQVKVAHNGKQQYMSQFEVQLRAQVKKALKDKSMPAIENVLREARKYDLVLPPPPAPVNGGVVVVPGRLTKESWESLFAEPNADGETDS